MEMVRRKNALDNLTFVCHHIRPDISNPRISTVTCKPEDQGYSSMIPFAPGIPELYDLFIACSVKHSITISHYHGLIHELSAFWAVSCAMVDDLATELRLSREPNNPYPFVRAVMQRGTFSDIESANTVRDGLNCQSSNPQKPDAKTMGWEIPTYEEVEMRTATETTLENVVENDMKADIEKDNCNHNQLEMDDDIDMNTVSEEQTMKEPSSGRPAGITPEIEELLLEVHARTESLTKELQRNNKQIAKNLDMLQNKMKAMNGNYINNMRGGMVGENNACHQFKKSDTSGQNSTDGGLSVPQIVSTPMDDIGPKLESQPKRYKQHKTETERKDGGNDKAGVETSSLIDSSSEPEQGAQRTVKVGGGLLGAVKMVLDAGEQLQAKTSKAGKGHKKNRDMISKDQMEDDDKNRMAEKNKDTKIPSSQSIAFVKSGPDATPECQDGPQLRSKSMTSPRVNNSCAGPVQYKNDMVSNSTQDQGHQFTHDRTDSTMWTPDQPSLGSYQNSLDINTQKAFRKPTPHEAIQLAILEIVKEVARGL